MNLQKIVFPKKENRTNDLLYFESTGEIQVDSEKRMMTFKANSEISFHSYFNSFSIGKWKKYTVLEDLFINFTFKGRFTVTIIARDLKNNLVYEKSLNSFVLASDETETIELNVPELNHDLIFFKVKALENNGVFFQGCYCSKVPEEKAIPTDICAVICTYNREEYIKTNIDILTKYILENQHSSLQNHLFVYIIDNGRNLDKSRYENPHIKVFYNKNTGAAGGFTRGLIESMEDQRPFSHVLFLDDDTNIEPTSLERTYNFLRLRKESYKDLFVGGSMLNKLKSAILEESGASWNGGNLISYKKGLDLTSGYDVLYNETEEPYEYTAWWYCCLPLSVVQKNGLLMPLFLRGDDIEYGLRNIRHLVLLNGICIWHEPFDTKYASFLNYYIFRNLLICNAIHYPKKGRWFFLKLIYKELFKATLFYKYKEAELILDGVADYFKGIDWLKMQDPEELHQKISQKGYKPEPLENYDLSLLDSFSKVCSNKKRAIFSKIYRITSLNGFFLKAKYNRIAYLSDIRPSDFFRAKMVMIYDIKTLKTIMTKKSYRAFFRIIRRTIQITIITLLKYKKTKCEYRNRQGEITNIQFWKEYLGL